MFKNFYPKIMPFCFEVIWKNTTSQTTNNNTVWSMISANWKAKAANTYSEYVILMVFPQKQLLQDCTWVTFIRT